MNRFHVDNDFLVYALTYRGPERRRLDQLDAEGADIAMSAIAWYEFCRGPRSPAQLAVARAVLRAQGIVPFTERVAERAAEAFHRMGSPRRRAADIAIAMTAAEAGAVLLTCNGKDFMDIDGLAFEDFPRLV